MPFERRIETRYDASTTGFDRGTRRVEQQLARLERTADRRLSGLDRRFERSARSVQRLNQALVGLASGAALRGFDGVVRSAINEIDNIAKSADRIGITTDALQELRAAANLSDVSDQALESGLGRLARTALDASRGLAAPARAFQELGIEVVGVDGELKSIEQLLAEVSDGIAVLGNETRQAGLAQEIFGRAGRQLLPLLAGGSGAIEDQRQRWRELGRTIDAEFIRQTVDAKDALTLIDAAVRANTTVALANLGPLLVRVSGFFADLSAVLPGNAEEFQSFANALQVTALAAGTLIGARALGGVTRAIAAGSAARAEAVVQARALVATTRAEVAAAEQSVVSKGQVFFAQQRNATSARGLERAKASLVAANGRLTAAQARATAASSALSVAQGRLSIATRATTTAVGVLRGALAFFGGVPGLILTAAAAVAFFATSVSDASADLQNAEGSVAALQGAIQGVEQAQQAYQTAISATAGVQTSASNRIVADTRREFEAKKRLLELEADRQRALQRLRLAEIESTTRELASANSRVQEARDPNAFFLTGAQRRNQEGLFSSQARRLLSDLQRLNAEADLVDAALSRIDTAVSSGFAEPENPPAVSTGGGAAVRDERDAYAELIEFAADRQQQLRDEIDITRAAADQVTELTIRRQLLAEARQAGIDLGEAEIAQLGAIAAAEARLTENLEQLRQAREVVDSVTQSSLTTEEWMLASRERLEALLPSIIELVGDEARAQEILGEAIRQANQEIADTSPYQDLSRELLDIAQSAETGEEALRRFLNALAEIALQDFIDVLGGRDASRPFGGIFEGIINGLSNVELFNSGGPTGGVRNRPAGIVHGQEFVIRAGPAQQYAPLLEAINSGLPSFNVGGMVAPAIQPVSVPSVPVMAAPSVNVQMGGTVINNSGSELSPAALRELDRRDNALLEEIAEMNYRDPGSLPP